MSVQFSIILPIYNQADHVGKIVGSYLDRLTELPVTHEILLCVNACRDDSLNVCTELARQHPTVSVLHSEKGGWGLAVKMGLAAAKGEVVCYTNSARTTPEDLLLILMYSLANPGKVIKANRKIRENLLRRAGSLLYNLECRLLFDLSVWDINGTPKAFPRSKIELLGLTHDDDLIDAEFCTVCRDTGALTLEVPIFSARRHGGVSTTRLSSALCMYLGALRMWRRRRMIKP